MQERGFVLRVWSVPPSPPTEEVQSLVVSNHSALKEPPSGKRVLNFSLVIERLPV